MTQNRPPREGGPVRRLHTYDTEVTWTGNLGDGTSGYRSFSRAHEVTAAGPPPIFGSSDPAFRGDPTCWNPEQLLVASLSQCHMLWYLYLSAVGGGVIVTAYTDHARGTMEETDVGGRFTEVVLHPHVEIAAAEMVDKARALHADAHRACFIANSVNFPVHHEPTISIRDR